MNYTNVFLTVGYALVIAFGISGNALVLRYFMRHERTISNTYRAFIIHLAMTDLLSSLLTPIYLIMSETGSMKLIGGNAMCDIGSTVFPGFTNSSAWIIVGLCYVRYKCISEPFKSWRFKARHVHIYCIITLILSISMSCLKPIKLQEVSGQCILHQLPKEIYHIVYSYIYYIMFHIVPLLMVLFFTCAVRRTIKTSRNFNFSLDTATKTTTRKINNRNDCKRTEQSLSVASVLHLMFTLPAGIYYIIICFLIQYYDRFFYRKVAILFPLGTCLWFFYTLNSVVNCFVYAGRNPGFKEYLRDKCNFKKNFKNINRIRQC